MRRWLFLVLALAGCGDGSPAPAPSESHEPEPTLGGRQMESELDAIEREIAGDAGD